MPSPSFPHKQHHRFVSLAIIGGGFQDGLEVEFSDKVVCAIGGRGSGKTNLLEMIAHSVQPAGTPLGAHVLGTGTLRVVIEAAHGGRYTIEREARGTPRVTDERGRPMAAPINELVRVDHFRVRDIEDTAVDPGSQLRLIDGFEADEMREIGIAISNISHDLQQNALELEKLITLEEAKRDDAAEAVVLAEKLRALAASGSQASNVTAAYDAAGIRQRERQVIVDTIQALAKTRDDASRFAAAITRRFASLMDDALLSGVNGDVMSQVASHVTLARLVADRGLAALNEGFETAEAAIGDRGHVLASRHEEQEAAYQKLLKQAQEETSRVDERTKLQQKHASALTAQKQLEQAQAERRNVDLRRRDLLTRLSELRDRRFKVRRRIAQHITNTLTPDIRVQITQGADKETFKNILVESLRNSGMKYRPIAEKISDALTPEELAGIVRRRDAQALAQRAGYDVERATTTIEKLSQCATVCAIEMIEFGDTPVIELLDGEYKDSAQVSPGQRCTAILPIVLLESKRPLIIDQPEDHLDKEFFCDVIIETIRKVKEHRQLFFATHDANLPVLADAEMILKLVGKGRSGLLAARGNVEEMKAHLLTLDGGAKAFKERMKRYGF